MDMSVGTPPGETASSAVDTISTGVSSGADLGGLTVESAPVV